MLVDEHDRKSSRAEVGGHCRALAEALRGQGVSEKDRVVLSARNSGDLVHALLALIDMGVSIALVDRRLPQAACAELVAESGARWFLSDHEELDDCFDRVRVGWIRLGDLTATAATAAHEDAELDFGRWAARKDGLIVWSSGSTGAPKGIVRSGASVLDNVERSQERMRYTESSRLLPLLPFTHQYGLSMLLLWWRARADLVIAPSRRIDLAVELIARHAVTVVDAVPALYYTLLRIVDSRPSTLARLDSVRMWCVGGEPLSEQLRQQFAERVGKPLLDGYGSSEVGNIALASPENPVHCGQPLAGVGIEVLGEDGSPVPPGVIGEIVVRTPDMMAGVLEPGGRVRPLGRTVHHTQDVGTLDEHGNLRVLGRKWAVHRFGHTLYPDAIAEKAGACGVPVQVFPVADGVRSTQLVFVVADPGGRPSAHWRRVINKYVAEYEQPNRVVVLDGFPLTSNGKVDRRALQDVAAAAVALEGVKGVLPVSGGHAQSAVDTSAIPFPERLEQLSLVVNLLRERRSEVMELLTEVSNYKTAYSEIDASIAALEGAAAEVSQHAPPQVEQISVLMPSNIPLYGYVLYLVVPSLYCRRLVFRPSRRIADLTRKLHELLGGVHDLPIVLNDLDQREFLDGDGAKSDVLVFTGAYENAEKIRTGLRSDQLFLYFGQGVNPFVVGPGVDIPKAVDGLLRVRMLNSGQDCFGPDVVFVHASVSAQFCNLLCRRVDALRFGQFDDPTADYGRMFYLDALDASLEYLRRNREYLAAGGEVNLVDDCLRPTVLIHPADTRIVPPELFAPIFNVVPFTTQEWLHSMIEHPYYAERALAATVFGALPETVELLRRRHAVSVDETLIEIENGNAPFGGLGMRANYAALGKRRYAEPLLLSKAVADHLSAPVTTTGRTA
ncbi:aldehyde dehydrogenase family protein [Allokutzneria sp. A3M-2-11 16]|uniref:aldehyde dehydrogenase family protein n=1 Tax=Allokutzneria sp. A3M-2-11 16 TaxID=2962043 RepID=UPI0020B6D929|nr:aldehyde dehydrogenase family protein [Allokutzneria sp. A3M-2-11 16]MCP3805295.1 aldehyde dehydrogenase family protein [Allokutzneria sp. A3M-2-11 16]